MSVYSGPGFIRANGVPCVKSASIDLKYETNNKDVDLLLEGHGGHSKGARKVVIKVEQAIPNTGFEVNWLAVADAQVEIALDFVIPGVMDVQCVGDVRDVGVRTKVSEANGTDFEFHGRITGGLAPLPGF